MNHPSRKFWASSLTMLAILGLLTGVLTPFHSLSLVQAAQQGSGTNPPYISGPYTDEPNYPTVYNGDLRDLLIQPSEGGEVPAPRPVKQPSLEEQIRIHTWLDPIAQQTPATGQMLDPISSFDGLNISDAGGWHPPDTNGDVGPNHYIQTVNIAIGIYDKATGAELLNLPYNSFFQGPNNACDNQNRGDVIVLYDPLVDRWIVTDFSLPSGGPYYECIAVSQSGDPISGGWYFYALQTNTGYFANYWHDYPKLSVWSDGWYMSANMFDQSNNYGGVRVWALDRASMISGGPLNEVHFECVSGECGSLLSANIRGALPPEGSPAYFANIKAPGTLNIWQFHTDWETPGNSTFTGPVALDTADFQMPDWTSVPQKNTSQLLDTLGDRLMFQLQYRNLQGVESLYANHSVASGGVIGIRWYEVRDPGGTPIIFQQGTYQPDQNYRWMGSIAADGEGNIAVGYSVSSSNMFPAIRYAGRLAGEIPNLLTQNEASLIEGTGSQTGSNRWGDYSDMTVDPTDDCTFWYTQEYFKVTSGNWETRIGSFKFPSCGQPKGAIAGYVYNSVSNLPVAGAPVFAVGTTYNFSTVTDENGYYTMNLLSGSYDLTAGPYLPGYPGTDVANGVIVVTGNTTEQHFYLDPVPSLVHDAIAIVDPEGNNNGFVEPGENDLQLLEALYNQGATTSTGITARITSLTEGVTVDIADTTYPDIAAGITETNISPYVFSVDYSVPCGSDLDFQAVITDSFRTYNTAFSLNASVPLPRQFFFYNDVENGATGWTTGGTGNSWAITTNNAHSPTHSWSDSPAGNYQEYVNSWLRTPAYNLSGKRLVELSGWFDYDLEEGWDYVYVEYSLNGGSSWNPTPLASFTGTQGWHPVVLDAGVLDNQPNVAIRFHLVTDSNTNAEGIYIDDVALSYEPFECNYSPVPDAPALVSPSDGATVNRPVTFVWQPAETGGPVEGYVFYLDDTPVMTFTSPITTTTLDISPWSHTWFVKATNATGDSLPSLSWFFNVIGKLFLPITQK